ncbi:MAG: DUF6114 domain-containing protein [Nitrososphaerota archaeon]
MEEAPGLAFTLSLSAAVLMLLFGFVGFMTWTTTRWCMGMMCMWGWSWPWSAGLYYSVLVNVVSGIVVLIGALMLYSRPKQVHMWGTLVLIFSIISLVSMGGFIIGAILGIVGGALAIAWKPTV